MAPKRKASTQDAQATDMATPAKKTKSGGGRKVKSGYEGGKGANDEAYTSQQKAAISQFMSFASPDRPTAVKYLKNAAWDASAAVNAYFNGGGGSATSCSTKTNLNKLFDSYRDDIANSPDSIGPEGSMAYFEKLDVDVTGMEVLAVMEVVQAPTMGEISREGFVDGWTAVNADTLDKQKAHIKSLKRQLPTNREAFDKVYKYTFLLGKTGGQKAVPLETALTYWELLFTSPMSAVQWTSPTTPWFEWWTEFVNSVWKKSVNRDMWNETLKFAKLTLEDEAMTFWNEESSWPSVIDDFVEWVKKEKRGGVEEDADAMEE